VPIPADLASEDESGARAFPTTAERLSQLATETISGQGLPPTIEWRAGKVRLLDQRALPQTLQFIETNEPQKIAEAIRTLQVRGAPAIGITAAYTLAAVAEAGTDDVTQLKARLIDAASLLRGTRPTAVNLAWAIDRTLAATEEAGTAEEVRRVTLSEAQAIHAEDVAANHRLGDLGAALLPESGGILTHCNAGALATGGYGTALGVLRAARAAGKLHAVYIGESRPLLQGARLTTWELLQDGFDVTLLGDAATGSLFAQGRVTAVIVGSDRIAANGDVANKIGTYGLAVLAKAHGVPFYAAAPWSTVDLSTPSGDRIPIEQRSGEEVTHFAGVQTAPDGVRVVNPAFDVTPARLVSAIVTERGVHRRPYESSLRAAAAEEAVHV
jgi:methylthioribose-1-phosphate isomerase